MPFITREEALKRLYAQVKAGRPIVGCGAGTGISAKFAEKGGADLIIIYNSGRYRMAGRGSLAGLMPYGDANAIVVEMAAEVLPVVRDTPVQAGVCGTDPFRLMPVFIKQLKEMGFTGVQNFPTVGLIDGTFRTNLEATGMGYDKEIEAIAIARQLDMLTTPYVFDPDQAKAMVEAGADVLVAHVGLTTAGSIGAGWALTLDEAIDKVNAIAAAGKAARRISWSSATAARSTSRTRSAWLCRACRRLPAFSARRASSVCPPSARLPSRSRISRTWRWGDK